MKTIKTLESYAQFLAGTKGQSIGFIPTMGALHQGHLALVKQALAENDLVVCSIYVNPTQFNNAVDLEKYPVSTARDLQLLEEIGCHAALLPTTEQIYPNGPASNAFDFEGLDQYMEGAHRPGHFDGMATVVCRLFEIVQPSRAYFGEKDFQQLAIVKLFTAQCFPALEIVPCPIYREEDGLAMSSRNRRLTPEQRSNAPVINATITAAIEELKNTIAPQPPRAWEAEQSQILNRVPDFAVEYILCCNASTLAPIEEFNPNTPTRVFVAVDVGGIRLIDNYPLF